ncbi:hypothetical protein B296_00030023 [Ensete ventricosum]|uniref:15-cis-phytoene synthase n=1 Tax=Ensete ventricosum TaxID=4639 RepID=A0A426XCG7_ENSVE|nr:hypothetical protein B296_00030023 [Ensete ventricosum]
MSGSVVWVVSPKETSGRSSGFNQFAGVKRRCRRSSSAGWSCARSASTARRSVSASLVVTPPRSSEELVYDVVLRQAALVGEARRKRAVEAPPAPLRGDLLDAAYERCGEVCAERTDELVDGPNASHITPTALDRWSNRLEDLFAGRPYDMYDAALSDTVSKFPVDMQVKSLRVYVCMYHSCGDAGGGGGSFIFLCLQPFKDMTEGMRMDLRKSRYNNFDELYLYCYYVAGTVGLMSVPVMGIAPDSKASTASVYSAALALGIANQLTNILRDVGEE